jgi:hypothetical protein
MPTFTEPNRIGDVLKREFDHLYNRETVTVVSGQNLTVGTVVGKVAASGKFTAYDNDAVDGEQTAAGILLFDCDASGGDARGVILARGPAVVSRDHLAWGAGVTTQGEKDAAYVDLAALGITLREAI